MSTPLFVDASISLEKTASYSTELGAEPGEWPIEVIREAYKQLPFLKSYETDVELDRVDGGRGFAVGKMLVYPARMKKEAAAQSKKLIVLPVVVRDKQMAPLDVYSYGSKMQPMDQDKVAAILFKPEMFEQVAPRGKFTGTNLFGQMTPPNTDHQYNAGSLHKHGSANLTKLAASCLSVDQIDRALQPVVEHVGLAHAYSQTPKLRSLLDGLVGVHSKTAAEKRSDRLSMLKPTALQFVESGTGYKIKTANHACYQPQVRAASRFQVQKLLSEEHMDSLLSDGILTLTVNPVHSKEASEATAQKAERVGRYRVWSGGQAREGIVIPKMMDFDGGVLDVQVFAGEGEHALQEKVAGVFLKDARIEGDHPRGAGVLVYQEGEAAIATEPIKVAHISRVGSQATLLAKRMATGEDITISVVPGLQKIAKVGDHVAVPPSVRFLSLNGSQVGVSDSEDVAHIFEHQKTASSSSIELISDGSSYSIRGANAAAFRGEIMDGAETQFALASLGLTRKQSASMMKTARVRDSARAPYSRRVIPEGVRGVEALTKTAAVVQGAKGLSRDLTKELALLTSPKAEALWKKASVNINSETVDAVLSLNFVTPENASLYVNYLSDLEKSASQLAELLVASRLGMDQVRESAAKNAMSQMSAVIKGLQGLRERIG